MNTVEIESWNNIVLVITGNVNSDTSVPENIFIIYKSYMVGMLFEEKDSKFNHFFCWL